MRAVAAGTRSHANTHAHAINQDYRSSRNTVCDCSLTLVYVQSISFAPRFISAYNHPRIESTLLPQEPYAQQHRQIDRAMAVGCGLLHPRREGCAEAQGLHPSAGLRHMLVRCIQQPGEPHRAGSGRAGQCGQAGCAARCDVARSCGAAVCPGDDGDRDGSVVGGAASVGRGNADRERRTVTWMSVRLGSISHHQQCEVEDP
jgi:hypothetical protein